ncbi:MAG: kinase [Verrucomicrobiales bacterium]|nr:kinase [Verrucomicrobiales bacterium]
MKKTKIKSIGLIANAEKLSSRALAQKAASLITKAGQKVFTDQSTASFAELSCPQLKDAAALAKKVDLLLVFGGDGTILRVVREINGSKTPILGINAGRLGFLTAVPAQDLPGALQRLWDGEFTLEKRALIDATCERPVNCIESSAFNDVVISRGAISRMIELEVSVNGEIVTCYRCDGLIISTPTGSTAYSLSAGGAIINPSADVVAITPICPHTLSNRSVIVGLDSVISVKVISEKVETTLTTDGQTQINLNAGDVVVMRRSKRVVQLVHLGGSSFFETVRRKLHWSGSNV